MYRVTIVDGQNDPITFGDTTYEGISYQNAFDKAVEARHNERWRKRWIRFDQPGGVTKWAQII